MSFKHISLLVLLAAGSATAQSSVFIPDADASKGLTNGIPFGIYDRPNRPWAKKFKYQTLVTAAQYGKFAAKNIRDLAFASGASGVQRFSRITIRMDQTTRTKLDRAFAKNLTSRAVTVLNARDYYWHHKKDKWNWIGLDLPFPFTVGMNLVIDIEVEGGKFLDTSFVHSKTTIGGFRDAALAVPRLWAARWNTVAPATGKLSPAGLRIGLSSELASLGSFGIGCLGNGKTLPALTLSGSSALGKQVNIELSRAKPGWPAILILDFGSPMKLPYNPVPIGNFAGCNLSVAVHVSLIAITDAAGASTVSILLPNMAVLLNGVFNMQFFQAEFNPLTLRASNYGRVLMGR